MLRKLEKCLHPNVLECGGDEAGRGCLAGPVFAGAVIFPTDYYNSELNDSKQLNERERYRLRSIIEKDALAWAVASIDHTIIDKINILNASILAIQTAVRKLSVKPEFLLVDGNRFKYFDHIPYQCIVGGDGKYMSIAAASILAKTYRDDYMNDMHYQYPQYNWLKNKGYPTAEHRRNIAKYGISPIHRRTFKLKNEQLDLFVK